ncbi:hypothetical protein C8J57DRAFT_1128505 [Mycena rebaudengoi]|nr:hypothetical protein C8J57DRAFT_1128505 [Mycena rebaudengoi]
MSTGTIQAFRNGMSPIVTTRGPGKLHLLSYDSNGGLPNHQGFTQTMNDGVTRFIISHSYTFTNFAFYWEGNGEAVWTIGDSLMRQPVGTSWATATSIPWNGQPLQSANVQTSAQSAVVRDNAATCFIVPPLT